jgi:hypothetical protein
MLFFGEDSACATHFRGAAFRCRDDETELEVSTGNRWNGRGKLKLIDTATMPAAASENTFGTLLGAYQANRRCSEWREAVRPDEGSIDGPQQSPVSAGF